MDAQQTTVTGGPRFTDHLWSLVTSPYIWGGVATVGFYKAIPHLPAYRELAERYFCAHPVEYVQTALFFIGLFILVRKLLRLRSQRAALRACTLRAAADGSADRLPSSSAAAASHAAAVLDAWSASVPAALRQTWMAQRIADVRQYLQLRPTADALESQIKDLEQRAGDELHDSFALLQTINWAIPIMGFLGTVLGITMAIFNLDVNHLDASLSEVTFNLAVAFDTTAVALCHSLILVFLYLFVKGWEERTLAQVASFSRRQILPLIPGEHSQPSPLLEAEAAAARHLVERTGQLIESQTQLWTDSIENLRNRWSGTLDVQQQSLAQALHSGTQSTLDHHADHLHELRGEFLRALQQMSQQRAEADAKLRAQEASLLGRWETGTAQLASVLTAAQQAADERSARMLTELSTQFGDWCRQLQSTTDTLQQRLAASEHAADERTTRTLSELSEQFDGWKSQLQTTTGSLAAHVERLSQQEARVCDLLERGDDVISLEEKLTDNLQALRAAETFEQTMHSLSAAVHLLTAHSRQRAA